MRRGDRALSSQGRPIQRRPPECDYNGAEGRAFLPSLIVVRASRVYSPSDGSLSMWSLDCDDYS